MEGSRPATAADVERLRELVRVAEAELRPMRGGELWLALRSLPALAESLLAEEIDDASRLVVVGTVDGVVVGYGRAHRVRLPDGRLLGVVDDLFVEAGAREVGVGEAMMNDVVEWCRANGCAGVDAIALPGHRSAKNFFEESGFTARLLVMHKRLEETGDA